MILRTVQAMLLSAAAALLGGALGQALGVRHFWPGVILAFLVFVPMWMHVLTRIARERS